jgi:cytochrome c553
MTNTRLLLGTLAIALLAAGCGNKPEEGHAEDAAGTAAAAQSSSAGLPAGNIANGEKLASAKVEATGQACVDCHGREGAAPIDPAYPVLAGQYQDYIAYALQMYRDGRRQNTLMASQAKGLTDQQIADLSAYFGSRQSKLRDMSEAVAN